MRLCGRLVFLLLLLLDLFLEATLVNMLTVGCRGWSCHWHRSSFQFRVDQIILPLLIERADLRAFLGVARVKLVQRSVPSIPERIRDLTGVPYLLEGGRG